MDYGLVMRIGLEIELDLQLSLGFV